MFGSSGLIQGSSLVNVSYDFNSIIGCMCGFRVPCGICYNGLFVSHLLRFEKMDNIKRLENIDSITAKHIRYTMVKKQTKVTIFHL